MLTKDGCQERRSRLCGRMDGPWDALLIHLPQHLLYFANFYPLPNSLNLHSSSFLLVERSGKTTLFTDNWLSPSDQAAVDESVVTDWYTCKRPASNRAQVVGEALMERLKSLRVRTLAAELCHLPCSIAAEAKRLVDIEPSIRKIRETKDPDEIAAIRRGIRTAEAIHHASRGLLQPGISEIDYYARLLEPATVAAGVPFVMMCDLASGPRAAEGGGGPTSRIMNEGELVILDMFPYVEGYRGDITNTLVVGGKPTGEQRALFALVHEGLKAAEKLLRPGTPVREIFHAVDSLFRRAPDGRSKTGTFTLVHHAGHNLGLGHPESPEIVPESECVLQKGMVMTLEPGIYGAPTGGVRLEHDYLITDNGPERLSNHQLGLE